MNQGVVVIGVQWGDEGKGKIVDYYAAQVDIVARFQGGNNAGHTLVVNGEQTILHLIPSGILHKHSKCFIGSGVVVDPEVFLKEIDTLQKLGHKNLEDRIYLSDRCHLILDYHKLLDEARENHKEGKIGTTKRGIGPSYEDKVTRRGIRVADLYDSVVFEKKFKENLEEKNFLLEHLYKTKVVPATKSIEYYRQLAEKLKPFVRDVSFEIQNEIKAGKKILFEGAQGILLDVDYGTYPYVTSSHTLPSQAALGLGARLPKDTLFMGILKAYSTRVGEGPFPTELKDAIGENLRKKGNEFGATTGRARRCGWLDLVAVNYTLKTSGINNLAVTKSDVLSGFEELKVCIAYEINGNRVHTIPANTRLLESVKPIYETLPGWSEDLTKITKASDLPQNFKDYIHFIEKFTESKVNLISTGAGREHVIDIQKLF